MKKVMLEINDEGNLVDANGAVVWFDVEKIFISNPVSADMLPIKFFDDELSKF